MAPVKAGGAKSDGAFLTISELSNELGVPQHVLRYWETRFPQLRPLTRAGNRRYYRAADVALARRIHHLLGQQGYTVRGVRQLLAEKGRGEAVAPAVAAAAEVTPPPVAAAPAPADASWLRGELRAIRAMLAGALEG